MNPHELGIRYDKIAGWWQNQMQASSYGLSQLERAVSYCENKRTALDVGCASGGRMIHKLSEAGFAVTGLDVSAEMLRLARQNHPEVNFHQADICDWQADQPYDLILAWDSIFHLPLERQAEVVGRLCGLLAEGGILLYTFGDAQGDHQSRWHEDDFYYSSIGISENLRVIMSSGCECRHLELDQYPQKHVYVIVRKTPD
ncbi:MAG: class I SAM-dependent methyltransferase [Cyclobacteriaceae bacterium]